MAEGLAIETRVTCWPKGGVRRPVTGAIHSIDGDDYWVRVDGGGTRRFHRDNVKPLDAPAPVRHRAVATPSYERAELRHVPKTSTYEDPEHVKLVGALPCAWCGRPGPSWAHHFPERSRGGKDHDVIPLCKTDPATNREGCHDFYHRTLRLGRLTHVQTAAWFVEAKVALLSLRIRGLLKHVRGAA